MPAKSLELKHTIKLICELNAEIGEIENEIKVIMDTINSLILTITGISYRMDTMIIAEIGDFNRFDSSDKILAYAGMSPSTYQSVQLENCYAHMENVVPNVSGIPFTTPQNMTAIGMNPFGHIFKRNVQRGNITMLLYPMLGKNSCC